MKFNKRVVSIPVLDGVLIYHSLFGNPMVLPNDCFEKLFSTEGVNNLLKDNPEIIDVLLESNFLSEEDTDIGQHQKFVDVQSTNACKGKYIKQLDLIVSERCNLGCPHCIYYSGNPRNYDASSLMTIGTAIEAWEKYLYKARKNNLSIFQVHFGGAEPLMNWKLIKDVLEEFPKHLEENEKVSWSINTNVTLVNKSIAKVFAKYSVEVHTSIDGPREANDAVRITLSKKGTFDAICRKIDLLRTYGVNVSDISTTITEKNFDLVTPYFVQWLHENKITAFGVDVDLVGFVNLTVNDAVQKLVEIYWMCVDYNIECSGTWMTPFLNIVNKNIKKEPVAFCGAIKGSNLSITPSGEITLCAYMQSRVGTIKRWGEMFTSNSAFANLISERQPGRDSHCYGCNIEGHCGGQCHITREEASRRGNTEIIDKMCDFYRLITKTMLEKYANHPSSVVEGNGDVV